MKKCLISTSLFLSSLISPVLAEDFRIEFVPVSEALAEESKDEALAEESKDDELAEESKDFYMSIGGGIALPSNYGGDSTFQANQYDFKYHTDNPFFYSVGFGKRFNDYRVEFNYLKAEVEASKISAESGGVGLTATISPGLKDNVNSYMIYGYKDFPSESNLTPYAGLGVGIGSFHADDQLVTIAGVDVVLTTPGISVFSYALKGGIDYELTDNSALYTEATYQKFGSYQISEPGFEIANYDSTNYIGISAGIRFSF